MNHKKQLLIIGLALVCQLSQAQTVTTWTNGHSYQAVFADNPTWFQARDAAAAMTFNGSTGHLATFTTRAEQEFVIAQLGGGTSLNVLWLGGYQDTSAPDYSENYGGWRWITGEPWLGVASNDPVIPRSDDGFNNIYFSGAAENYTITWWKTGGVNDYYHSPSPALGDAIGGPARGYIVEFEVSTIAVLISPAGGGVEVCWPSRTNHSYQVQWRGALDTNTWSDFGALIAGNGGTNCVSDSTQGHSARFYRVVQLP
jgi:hypothetical protein